VSAFRVRSAWEGGRPRPPGESLRKAGTQLSVEQPLADCRVTHVVAGGGARTPSLAPRFQQKRSILAYPLSPTDYFPTCDWTQL